MEKLQKKHPKTKKPKETENPRIENKILLPEELKEKTLLPITWVEMHDMEWVSW